MRLHVKPAGSTALDFRAERLHDALRASKTTDYRELPVNDDAREWRWVGEDGAQKTVSEQELIAAWVDGGAHADGKRRFGSSSRRRLRPSQAQRETKTASIPSRRCNWQIATPGSSA